MRGPKAVPELLRDLEEVDDRLAVATGAPRGVREADGVAIAGDAREVHHVHVGPNAVAIDRFFAVRPVPIDVEGAVQCDGVAVDEGEVGAERPDALGVSRKVPARVIVSVGVDGRVTQPELPGKACELGARRTADLDRVGAVGSAVTIVVHAVQRDFRRVGVDGRIAIVAVGAGDEAVTVRIGIRGHEIAAVAVLVDAVVRNFRGAGVAGAVTVIAVRVVGDVARCQAAHHRRRAARVAVEIAIQVRVGRGAGLADRRIRVVAVEADRGIRDDDEAVQDCIGASVLAVGENVRRIHRDHRETVAIGILAQRDERAVVDAVAVAVVRDVAHIRRGARYALGRGHCVFLAHRGGIRHVLRGAAGRETEREEQHKGCKGHAVHWVLQRVSAYGAPTEQAPFGYPLETLVRFLWA